ncbi:MAG: hypothetical protein N2316_08080 [Spirochaetes bacterium]|nr:hypothetical protein [Spirochaetota bacterium]
MCRTFESCQAHSIVATYNEKGILVAAKENRIEALFSTERWTVPFQDSGFWRVGIYNPEFSSPDQIEILEKHTCPELFICRKGRMGLIIGVGENEKILMLNEGEAILVTDYHNGFRIDEGDFLVVERTSFRTEYIDRKSGKIIDIVNVT